MTTRKTYYVMQDGRDFYCFDKLPMHGDPIEIYSSIIKVPDWDLEAAQAARQWFEEAICKPNNILAIYPNPFA